MKNFFFTAIVLIVIGGMIVVFWSFSHNREGNLLQQARLSFLPTTNNEPAEKVEPPDGYHTYQDEQERFSLFYPEDLAVKTYDEGEGAETIVMQDLDPVYGLQIYIVPYTGTQVSPEQFNKDVPSGVRKNVQDIKIDGAKAAAFYSQDPVLGETYEIWFIHDGYLYEVTTLKALDSWLNMVIQEWHFL